MLADQKKIVINSQRDAFLRYGYHPHALLWSTKEIQILRFKILMEVGIDSDDSVMDVGCGFGDFSTYLQEQGWEGEFTGIDLSEELLQEGRERFPSISLIQGDIFDYDPADASFDYVTLSGALNRDFNDEGEYAYKAIKRMFEASRKGIAFNVLDARHEWTASRWDLQSFHPEEIEQYISQFSSQYQIVEGYLDNDFTVYAYKV